MAEINDYRTVGDTCEKYQDCDLQALTFEELIMSLFVKDTSGCIHINTVVTLGDCNNLTSAVVCTENTDWKTLLRKSIVRDDCGRPAISLFADSDLQV